jgi:hypothetical protein
MTPSALGRGARVLPRESFPWLPDALQTIERYRRRFLEIEEAGGPQTRPTAATEHRARPFLFHPVLSIFGPRGSGKTSALLTLLDEIQRSDHRDLVLPIVDPHRFVQDDRVLFAFLASLKPLVDQFSHEERGQRLDRAAPAHARYEASDVDDLAALFHDVSEQAQRLFQVGGEAVPDRQFERRYRLHYLSKGKRFLDGLDQIVRRLTERYQFVGHRRLAADQNARPPLMILPIDDTDLVPEYLDEVMTFIRILCPALSRLVIVVTADQNLALTCAKGRYARSMFADWPSTPYPERLFSAEEVQQVAEGLAWQFLVKFFPDEGSFFLSQFDGLRRISFRPDAGPTFGDLLDGLGLLRFIDLSWAIDVGTEDGLALCVYSDALSDNPRVLEQAYDVVERAGSRARGDVCHRRKDALFGLARLFLSQDWRSLQYKGFHVAISVTESRMLAMRMRGVSYNLSVRPMRALTADAWEPFDEAAPAFRWYLFSKHVITLSVCTVASWGNLESPRMVPLPPALAAATLFLTELDRPEFKLLAPDAELPELGLGRLGAVQLHGSAKPTDQGRLAEFPEFATLYPIAVLVPERKCLLCLPMPAWRWQVQWSIFSCYWDRVARIDSGLSIRKQKEGLFFHLVEASIRIGRMDPLATEPTPAGRLQPSAETPVSFDAILKRLQGSYELDVINGDGVLAEWVEFGLFRFLKRVEAEGIKTLADAGLSAEKVKSLVFKATALRLKDHQPELRRDLEPVVEKLDQRVMEPYRGSRLFRAFRDGIALAGPSASVGDLTQSTGLTEGGGQTKHGSASGRSHNEPTGNAGHIEPPADPA